MSEFRVVQAICDTATICYNLAGELRETDFMVSVLLAEIERKIPPAIELCFVLCLNGHAITCRIQRRIEVKAPAFSHDNELACIMSVHESDAQVSEDQVLIILHCFIRFAHLGQYMGLGGRSTCDIYIYLCLCVS